jgi:pimeloyl-ACP methyl ester carboxylesterase
VARLRAERAQLPRNDLAAPVKLKKTPPLRTSVITSQSERGTFAKSGTGHVKDVEEGLNGRVWYSATARAPTRWVPLPMTAQAERDAHVAVLASNATARTGRPTAPSETWLDLAAPGVLQTPGVLLPAARPRPIPAELLARRWMPSLSVDGTRRAYQVVGPADAPPIVFIHGTRVTRAMWRPQQVGLADAFRVVTIDLPGHGTAVAHRFRLAAAVEHVARIIGEVGGGRAVVVGLSLGGYVGMELGARHPELVAGLVICGASSEPWTLMAEPLRAAARLVLALEDGGAPARWDQALSGSRSTIRALERRGLRRIRLDGGGQALLEIAGRRFRPRLATYPGQTLIMNGARDRLFRRQEAAFLSSAQRGSLLVLPGAGHLSNTDVPEAFNRAVRRFASAADW